MAAKKATPAKPVSNKPRWTRPAKRKAPIVGVGVNGSSEGPEPALELIKSRQRLTGRAAELAEQLWHTQRLLADEINRRRIAEVTVSALQKELALQHFGLSETAESVGQPIPF